MEPRIQLAAKQAAGREPCVIGLDLGDRWSRHCVLDESGSILREDRVRCTAESLRRQFEGQPSARIVIETGTHSPWVSRPRSLSVSSLCAAVYIV